MSSLDVLKTYKIYIDGAFPRTESGRYYPLTDKTGKTIANMCLSSRKDFRNAVVAARKAQENWASRSGFNRAQILYRIAEMLEGRKELFIAEMRQMGYSPSVALRETQSAIDTWVYYAGWCDKYQAVFSSVNPVSSGHFNFTIPEPSGVVALIAPEVSPLAGLSAALAPVITAGNAVVALASEKHALCAISFAEVLATSDVPGGVINLLTGKTDELLPHISTHMDINTLILYRDGIDIEKLEKSCAVNVKRFHFISAAEMQSDKGMHARYIRKYCEFKTTWHPIEYSENVGGGY